MTERQIAWKRWYEKASQDAGWQERRRAAKRAEYLRARSKRLATAKRWAENNRDKTRAIWKRFYQNHIDAERQRSRNKSPEATRAAWHRYHEKNHDSYRAKKVASEMKRRAQKAGCETGPIDYEAIVQAANGACGICGLAIGDAKTHFDHIVPLAKGGLHKQTNLQLAHATCNIRKGARSQTAA